MEIRCKGISLQTTRNIILELQLTDKEFDSLKTINDLGITQHPMNPTLTKIANHLKKLYVDAGSMSPD